ncbi:MAG: glycosyltransferase family 2 protein [Dysgonamonadaceae bacterium]|nr:glycosyltransferase family 2 protein [Dysgonamonadaceae bacterium]MDD3310316.1 glycosyltransferase family 2 protein [Dysgonamonadaceae bacterium]MDD3901401.1 glycosyltransferase family 2 protein [Dysgonamonadaceae bacterium]MDD4399886.1 glycosyltransferase family 2 protein [Dysgonamonadaceae bacterium]
MITDKDKSIPAISIVMPAYNAEKYIKEAIDSIIGQSFSNFECIIVDDGSTDSTRDIIRSYNDERIVLLENKHDYIASLNRGMNAPKGKYLARMDADDIMHPDRLKIQYAVMEAEPSITVCGTWMQHIGERVPPQSIAVSANGLVEFPLLQFMKGNFMFHPTAVIRRNFLIENKLHYEKNYIYAEDLKLWTEIAKLGGKFYIDNQVLLYYRISETQITNQKREEQKATTERILFEVMDWLLERNKEDHPELKGTFESLIKLQEKELINFAEILKITQKIFITNKNKLHLA